MKGKAGGEQQRSEAMKPGERAVPPGTEGLTLENPCRVSKISPY